MIFLIYFANVVNCAGKTFFWSFMLQAVGTESVKFGKLVIRFMGCYVFFAQQDSRKKGKNFSTCVELSASLKGLYDSQVFVHVQIRNQRSKELYLSRRYCTAWSKCTPFYVNTVAKGKTVSHGYFQSFADYLKKASISAL